MTKIDIVSGFLGAGKTTFIKKMLKEAYKEEQIVLIENEFGEIGIDGGFLKEAGVEIKEMNSGCICCSLVGDFGTSLKEVLEKYHPDRIIIEPSGVGKLSDVMKAVSDVTEQVGIHLNSAVAVVDASKCRMYAKNFGEFFIDQIEHAGTIILSRTGNINETKLAQAMEIIREHNDKAVVITTPWDEIDGSKILETVENAKGLEAELMQEVYKMHEHHHDHDEECGCHEHHHEHDHDEECGCHEHDHEHHHDHNEECGCHEHHHEHDHDGECGCHEHHHHHADEVFTSWGVESPAVYTKAEVESCLKALEQEEEYGFVLRAKGMVPTIDGTWIHFDYVPEECQIRTGAADVTGKVCVIGSKLQTEKLAALWKK